MIKKVLIVFASSLWFSACSLVSITPTSQSTIPIPSTPTTPLLAVLAEYLENVHIVGTDPFDNSSGWNASNEISAGELRLVGSGGNDWHGLSNNNGLQEGEGVVINFTFMPDEFFEMYFEHGLWPTALYRRFGVYVNGDHANTNVFIGSERRDFLSVPGNLFLNPGRLYSLFMVVGRGGDFVAQIWDPANPEQFLRYREVIGNWKAMNWTFRIQVNRATITFDDFQTIRFDGIK